MEAETDGPEEKHRHCLSMHNRFSKAKAQMELSLASDMKGNKAAKKMGASDMGEKLRQLQLLSMEKTQI